MGELMSALAQQLTAANDRPVWDAQQRELRFRGVCLVRYTDPAPMQEHLLGVFQDADWLPHLDTVRGFDRDQIRNTADSLTTKLYDEAQEHRL